MTDDELPEPWLRGTLTEVPAVQRAAVHALQLAEEDLKYWCEGLTDEQMNERPSGLAPVAFHLRHIARSLDRLLTCAEERGLTEQQLAIKNAELDPGATRNELFLELNLALAESARRVQAFEASELEQVRHVGRKRLLTTLAGLLVEVAAHTQRHVGQAITTAKIVLAQRPARVSPLS